MLIELKNSQGETQVSYSPAKDFSSIVLSTPELVNGESCTLYADGEQIVTFQLSENVTFVDESGVTTEKSGGFGGGMGGPGGGKRRGF